MNKELGHDVLLVFPGDGRVSGKVSTFPQFSNKDTLQLVDVEHKANGLRAPSLCERWCISVCVHVCVSVSFCVIQSVCELAALKGGIITGKLSVCFNAKADEVDPPPDQLTPHTCRRRGLRGGRIRPTTCTCGTAVECFGADPPPDQLTPHTCRRSDRQGP